MFYTLFQVCVLGYCIAPLVGALIFSRLILFVNNVSSEITKRQSTCYAQGAFFFFLRFLVTLAAMGWSSRAAMSFIGDTAPEGMRFFVVLVVFLILLNS